MTTAFSDPPGISPHPPKSTPLLTRDEVEVLLRNRGFTSVAEDIATGHAGPPFVRWRNGEARYDWQDAYEWGAARAYRQPWDYFDIDEARPPATAETVTAAQE